MKQHICVRLDRESFQYISVQNCNSKFGGDEVLQYSVDRMRHELEQNQTERPVYADSSTHVNTGTQSSRPSIVDNKYVAMEAAVPMIQHMPSNNFSYVSQLRHKFYTLLRMLNQKHNWRHVASLFKSSGHVKRGFCQYKFPRTNRKCPEIAEYAVIRTERTIGSEYINNFNQYF